MKITYSSFCTSNHVNIDDKTFEDLSEVEIQNLLSSAFSKSKVTRQQLVDIIQIMGTSVDESYYSCETCGDYNYEYVWEV